MAIEINFDTNPIDDLRANETFVFKEGQIIVKGTFSAKDGAEYIVPDQAHVIQESD